MDVSTPSLPHLERELGQLNVDLSYAVRACKGAFERHRDLEESRAPKAEIAAALADYSTARRHVEAVEARVASVKAQLQRARAAEREQQELAHRASTLQDIVNSPVDVATAQADLERRKHARDVALTCLRGREADLAALRAKATAAREADRVAAEHEAAALARGEDPAPRTTLPDFAAAERLIEKDIAALEKDVVAAVSEVAKAAQQVAAAVYDATIAKFHSLLLADLPRLATLARAARANAGPDMRSRWDEFYHLTYGDGAHKVFIHDPNPPDLTATYEAEISGK